MLIVTLVTLHRDGRHRLLPVQSLNFIHEGERAQMKERSQSDGVTQFVMTSAGPSGAGDKSPTLDRRGNSAPSIRPSGPAHSLNNAPWTSTHRLYRAGHTLPPVAGSDFDFPFLPRERRVPYKILAKEIRHDQSSSARPVLSEFV
jgi:hypothetical protein